ncbi:hypothetical protein [Apilactobacillus micheneri]|uniref:hypothetical protein n=1 Tax=Apilactobacillus micheneri TaxID=1899430 RepID=UPI00112B2063|nr:hypothetical protein [Apilactobacillus micheneri]TPR50764.1 hypothetical protein DY126_06865 [Apilactobacillus micheneri]
MNKIKSTKLVLASAIFGSLLAPSIVASADTTNANVNSTSNLSEKVQYPKYDLNDNFNIPNFGGTTHSLSLKQQQEFNKIKESHVFSSDQLNEIVKDREASNNPSRISFKSAKTLITKAAKYLGKHISLGVIEDIADAMTNYQEKEQDVLQHALEDHLNVNSTVAYWTARAVVFSQW